MFDARGNISNQQDIVIFRNSYYPIFNIGGLQHFPVESVVAVLEVKSALGGRELSHALDCIASVKELDRTGGGINYIVAGGMQLVLDPNMHEHQIFRAVVGMSGMSSSATTRSVAEWCRGHERTQWPNGVVSAFDYSVYYDTPGDLPRSNPMLSRGLCSSIPDHAENTVPILDFLGQLISFLRVAPVVDFRPTNSSRAVYIMKIMCHLRKPASVHRLAVGSHRASCQAGASQPTLTTAAWSSPT